MYTHTNEKIGRTTNIKMFYDNERCATATINHQLKLINISYNAEPGEPAETESIEYKFFHRSADTADYMKLYMQSIGAPTIYE